MRSPWESRECLSIMFGETVRCGFGIERSAPGGCWSHRFAWGASATDALTPCRGWCELIGAHCFSRPKRPVAPPRGMGFSPRACTSGRASQAGTSRRWPTLARRVPTGLAGAVDDAAPGGPWRSRAQGTARRPGRPARVRMVESHGRRREGGWAACACDGDRASEARGTLALGHMMSMDTHTNRPKRKAPDIRLRYASVEVMHI
jgi:hypothetical protein